MNDSTFNVKMEEGLKTQFELLCSKFGVTASYVINMFAQTAVKNTVGICKTQFGNYKRKSVAGFSRSANGSQRKWIAGNDFI